MFGLFKKKSGSNDSGNQYVGRKFGPFAVMIPEDWNCINDNGTLRANKGDDVRLNISVRNMSEVSQYTLDSLFETVKRGYYDTDVNWGAYSEITNKGDVVYQTLEYDEDPRLILALVRKNVENQDLILTISFAGNYGKDIEMHKEVFYKVLENIEVIA